MKRKTINPVHILTPTVRFWYYHRNAWVRLTLRPAEVRHHSFAYWNGEGTTRESVTFRYDDYSPEPVILQRWHESGSDCDGRSSSGGLLACPLSKLSAVLAYHANYSTRARHEGRGIRQPAWEKVNQYQRDQYAEAMGY